MKFKIIFPMLFLAISFANAQGVITVTYDATKPVGSRLIQTTTAVQASALDPAVAIHVNLVGCAAGGAVVSSFNGASTPAPTPAAGSPFVIQPLSLAEITAYSNFSIVVSCGASESVTYTNVAHPTALTTTTTTPNTNAVPTSNFPANTAFDQIGTYFSRLELSDKGWQVTGAAANYPYLGDKYTHIFLDQFGNSLNGVIPQGIANRQYIVHIIYLAPRDNPWKINYSVKQTKGSFNPALVFNNSGSFSGIIGAQGTGPAPAPVVYVWQHQEFPLRISTDNIEFEVSRNILTEQNLLTLQSTTVATHTIEMSKIYHGSFDFGLLSSRLANPEYELVASANNPDQKIVKRKGDGDRGVVTVMATLYTSPIILIEKYLLQMDVPNYKLTGRNFLDDHNLIERIFPAVGVSITDKAFKNIFYGLNWEIARGASLFAGFHYGEVNTFKANDDFQFEETVVNEAEFNIRTNKEWKQDFAIGANLDLLLITNLFRIK